MLFSEKSTIYFNFGKTQYELECANYIAVQIRQKQSLYAKLCHVQKFGMKKAEKRECKNKSFYIPFAVFFGKRSMYMPYQLLISLSSLFQV